MFHFRFGSACFHNPNSEEMADMIVDLNTEYTNLFEFGEDCIKKIWEWEFDIDENKIKEEVALLEP